MDLEARKITFVQEFLRLQNEEIISALEKFMHTSKAELTERNMSPMSLEQLNTETDQSIEDAQSGRITKASDLRDKIKKWG
ncbi:hypothetical protein HYN59_10815 [Flavobacterium album]|uniref:Uncharacterized protein n=1 Tax=Flavobacterium album TaxID=2175091 RepID=A0A2S1QYZ8_9FLAO|nr:hypothetical protein [Flavobacterium album]AWH85569.1 hypothetical protein HYN59_10815 [Flavobacterium album]